MKEIATNKRPYTPPLNLFWGIKKLKGIKSEKVGIKVNVIHGNKCGAEFCCKIKDARFIDSSLVKDVMYKDDWTCAEWRKNGHNSAVWKNPKTWASVAVKPKCPYKIIKSGRNKMSQRVIRQTQRKIDEWNKEMEKAMNVKLHWIMPPCLFWPQYYALTGGIDNGWKILMRMNHPDDFPCLDFYDVMLEIRVPHIQLPF